MHAYDEKLCDLIFFWQIDVARRLALAVELKGGGASIDHVRQQLQSGADLISELAGPEVQFAPVLVHKRMQTMQMRALEKAKVRYRGKTYGIILMRCGGDLSKLKV
ncbi:hypothetical protein [Lentzea aerocolonigenes]|uniref:hypothetical protein n=1 Tax=Lentzea aerocolonigenes TaxID=68170 RepID=UPI0012E0FC15|nr:hypothetical protein [Lentzea aerocolonigenes]